MEYKLIRIRDGIIKEVWERQKEQSPSGQLTMKELAQIFKMPIPTIYRIVHENN